MDHVIHVRGESAHGPAGQRLRMAPRLLARRLTGRLSFKMFGRTGLAPFTTPLLA
jgi:hypothetical protein